MQQKPVDHANKEWFRQLIAFKPAKWVWGRSIRAAIGVGLPLAIGIATNHIPESLFVSLGSLTQAPGERDDAYQFTFLKIFVSAICGALGLMLGYLGFLPWIVIIGIMMVLGFLSTIISFHSSVLSSGFMLILMMATIALCNPDIKSFMPLAGLFMLGSAFYALLLGVEALFSGNSPRRKLLIKLIAALQKLALSRAEGKDQASERQQVTTSLNALYQMMLETRFHAWGRNPQSEQTAAIVQKADAIFTLILGTTNTDTLKNAAADLQKMQHMLELQKRVDLSAISTGSDRLTTAVRLLGETILNKRAFALKNLNIETRQSLSPFSRLKMSLDSLSVSKDNVLSALAFSMCLGIGLSFHFVDRITHWYWIPMTIVIVMRPDMGSVFGRTALRCIGTSAGGLIGAAILIFVPVGTIFVIIMAAIALLMPWAIQKSYALFSLILTPLVLVLIDYVSPETKEANYAIWRFADTLAGGAIVIVFGYLIWPKRKYETFERCFAQSRSATAKYLKQVIVSSKHKGADENSAELGTARRLAYGTLADMRATLQKALGDPPPAGLQAVVWFPVIASMERMCDTITSYSTTDIGAEYIDYGKALDDLVFELKSVDKRTPSTMVMSEKSDDAAGPAAKFIADMQAEILHLSQWHKNALSGQAA